LGALLFAGATFLCAKLAVLLSAPASTFLSFWLPAGLYLGVLLLRETRDWPWFVLAALPANVLFDWSYGTPPGAALGFAAADAIEALAGAWLVRRFVAQRPELGSLKELTGLLVCGAVLSPAVGAVLGAWTLTAAGMSHSYWKSWADWWGNNAMAASLLTPLLLAWSGKWKFKQPGVFPWARVGEAALLTVTLAGSAWYVLTVDKGINAPYKSRLILPLVWAGLRFGRRGATAANLFLALLMAFFTTHYLQGLTPVEIAAGSYVGTLQSFLTVAVIIALVPTVVLAERNRKVLALEQGEERFRRAFDDAPIGMSLVSPEGRWLRVNEALCQMLGWSETEMLQSDFQHITHPEDLQKDLGSLMQVLSGEIPSYQMEKRYFHKSGTVVPVNLSVSLVRNLDGEPLYFVSQIENITERKQYETEREKLIGDLQQALAEVKKLSGLLPICASCKKIRDDSGYWNQIETYITKHSSAFFSHGICPQCADKFLKEAGLTLPDKKRGDAESS
jgi:PAS domain S-box-containing protein